MRPSRVVRMYLPKQTRKPEAEPLGFARVRDAYRTLYAAAAMALVTVAGGFVYLFMYLQQRERPLEQDSGARRSAPDAPRVVIVGGGAGGAAVAASLARAAPDAHITVVERDKKQVFTALVPLAAVGHRSYDMITTSGINFLFSPATWNVTREAQLVHGTVTSVDARRRLVRVSVVPPLLGAPPEEREVPYDVLVVAAGAQRSLGALTGRVAAADVDRARLAVQPGAMRDNLMHTYAGTVLYAKVPPASFGRLLELERRRRPPAARVSLEELMAGLSPPPPDWQLEGRESLLARGWARAAAFWAGGAGVPGGPAEASAEQAAAAEALLADYMRFPARQHDGTFASTVNLIFRYLQDFGKFPGCTLLAVTPDAAPLGPAPADASAQLTALWRAWQQEEWRRAPGSGGGAGRGQSNFAVLRHGVVTSVDVARREAVLYDYARNVEVAVPYALLALDLPLAAPAFIARSGLSRPAGTYAARVRNHLRGAGAGDKGAAAPAAVFAAEEGFMDVDARTLQHRTHPEVFALGDAAGLPTLKSYGGVMAQVPVVAHNAVQVLHNQKLERDFAARQAAYVEEARGRQGLWDRLLGRARRDALLRDPAAPSYAAEVEGRRRAVHPLHDGYASTMVAMSPWRAMWPEMVYGGPPGGSPAEAAATAALTPVDHHLWTNTRWRGLPGLLNAAYYQCAAYELMHFGLFVRGMWYPPGWFTVPVFSPEDGSVTATGAFDSFL